MKHSTQHLGESVNAVLDILDTKPEIDARLRFTAPALKCIRTLIEGVRERDAYIIELEAKVAAQ